MSLVLEVYLVSVYRIPKRGFVFNRRRQMEIFFGVSEDVESVYMYLGGSLYLIQGKNL